MSTQHQAQAIKAPAVSSAIELSKENAEFLVKHEKEVIQVIDAIVRATQQKHSVLDNTSATTVRMKK